MSTLTEIEKAIELLPAAQVNELAAWLERRRLQQPAWPVPPPNVPFEELERVEAEIETAFPTKRD
jgi:hypothetical protein